MYPKVAVQIITYANGDAERADARALLASLQAVDYPKDAWCIVVIDNPSPHGTMREYIRTAWIAEAGKTLPQVFLVENDRNTGFAGGHSDGLPASFAWGAEYVYLLNQDARVEPTFLRNVVQVAETQSNAALVQSSLVLAQDPALLNSRGNALQYLGFGFCLGYKERIDAPHDNTPVFYASGAAVLIRRSAIETIGFFEPSYFMYHEDVDLSWRARLAGYEIAYAKDSVVAHRYEFSRSVKKFYWMERNRHLTNLTHEEVRTILVFLPMMLVMEFGTFLFALRSGWWREKLRAWSHFFRPSTWTYIRAQRKEIRNIRTVTDREILAHMCGAITNQDIQNPLLTYVVNPMLRAYFVFARWILR